MKNKIDLQYGDCIELMSKMRPESIDLTVTSPPYDNLRTYKNSLTWNEDIWKRVIELLYKVTKQGGVVVWVVGDATIKGSETGNSFKQALYFKDVGFNLHDTMIYESNKPPLTHNRYEQKFEYMFIFSKGKPNAFNPFKIPCIYAGSSTDRPETKKGSRRENSAIRSKKGTGKRVKNEKIKGNIWKYKTGGGLTTKDREAFKHPAIFPEQLANDHIISWSNENDTVFDPFMGSGTTGKMAILNNRNFIGIEKVKEYFDIAEKRIKEA